MRKIKVPAPERRMELVSEVKKEIDLILNELIADREYLIGLFNDDVITEDEYDWMYENIHVIASARVRDEAFVR